MENTGIFHLKLWLLKNTVNFKEPFSVLIKHLFTAADVALEWKTMHSFQGNICSEFNYYCIVDSGVILKPVRRLRGDLDLKASAQALPTFHLPTHNTRASWKWTNRGIMEIIWDLKLIPLLEQSSFCQEEFLYSHQSLKSSRFILFIKQFLPNYCKVQRSFKSKYLFKHPISVIPRNPWIPNRRRQSLVLC